MKDLLLPPELSVRYQPEVQLGAGAYGRVIRARDRQLDRPVALKLLKDTVQDPDQVARFEREARVTSELDHASVIEVYDYGVTASGTAYIVYELIEGETLLEDLVQRLMPPDQVRRAGIQLAEALATAHAAGILHRDVKPQNILLRRDGQPVLCDFGIARREEERTFHTAEGIILGTLQYMAPELLLGAPPSPATDQYALAATLYQLRFGVTVYPDVDSQSILDIAARQLQPPAPPVPLSKDEDLDAVLIRAVHPSPSTRLPDLRTFRTALRGEIRSAGSAGGNTTLRIPPNGAPRSAAPPVVRLGQPSTTARRRAPTKRRRFHPGAITALLLACVGVGLWPSSESEPLPAPPTRTLERAEKLVPDALRENYRRFSAFHRNEAGELASTLNFEYAEENWRRLSDHVLDPRFSLTAKRYWLSLTVWMEALTTTRGAAALDLPEAREVIDEATLFLHQVYVVFNTMAQRRGLGMDFGQLETVSRDGAMKALGSALDMAQPFHEYISLLDPLVDRWDSLVQPHSPGLLALRAAGRRSENIPAGSRLVQLLPAALLAEAPYQASEALLDSTLRFFSMGPPKDPQECDSFGATNRAIREHVLARADRYPQHWLGEQAVRVLRPHALHLVHCDDDPRRDLAGLGVLFRRTENLSFTFSRALFPFFDRYRWAYRKHQSLDESEPDPPPLAGIVRVRLKWERYRDEAPALRRPMVTQRGDSLASTAETLEQFRADLKATPTPATFVRFVTAASRWNEIRRQASDTGALSEAAAVQRHGWVKALLAALNKHPKPLEGAAVLRTLGTRLDPAIDAPDPCLRNDLAKLVQGAEYVPLRPLTGAACPH